MQSPDELREAWFFTELASPRRRKQVNYRIRRTKSSMRIACSERFSIGAHPTYFRNSRLRDREHARARGNASPPGRDTAGPPSGDGHELSIYKSGPVNGGDLEDANNSR